MAAVLRCKMRVAQVTQNLNESGEVDQETVKLQAVYGKDGTANKQWSKWTPSGNFDITINNPDAMGKLSRGKFFFVDFSPAEIDD